MKTLLISAVVLVSILTFYPSNVIAQELDDNYVYIGLFVDQERTSRCIFPDGGPGWLFVRPSVRGLREIWFRNSFPSNVTPVILLTNPGLFTPIGGDEACGWTVRFNECQTEWTWIYLYSIGLNDTNMSSTNISGECMAGVIDVQNCIDNSVMDSTVVLSNLLFNYPAGSSECFVGVDEISWGAIKALYNSSGK